MVAPPSGNREVSPVFAMLHRFHFPGGKITDKDWIGLKAFLKTNPHLRIKPGTPHPEAGTNSDCDGLVFIRYHRHARNGEQWGQLKAFKAMRRGNAAAFKKWREAKMASDPEFRANEFAKLRRLIEVKSALPKSQAAEAERKKRAVLRAQKSRAKRKAKAAAMSRSIS